MPWLMVQVLPLSLLSQIRLLLLAPLPRTPLLMTLPLMTLPLMFCSGSSITGWSGWP
jgi:hypothetical protein